MFWKKKKKQEEEGDAENQEYSEDEVDQIMDEAETSDSQDGESKPRSKNTKVALIGVIALVLLAGIYFGSKNYQELLVHKDKLLAMVGLNKEAPEKPEIPVPAPPKELQEPQKSSVVEAEKKSPEPKPEAHEAKPRLHENVAQEVPSSELTKPKAETPTTHPERTVARPEESLKEKAKVPAAPRSTPPAPTSSGKYAIQVGTFSIKENAVKLIQKLTESGYEAYGVPISGSGSRQKSIYAGPFYSKLEAEEAAEELRRSDVASARIAYDKSEASYHVEVGRPATEGASERLREKIRRLGYQDGGSKSQRGGDAMTAVYVGNFADKAQAEEAQRNLPKEDVPSSMIVEAPKRG